jgi:hypothetical protein
MVGARVNNFHQKAVLFLVTGAGVGYIPRLPGTLGTMIAIPFSLALNRIAFGNFSSCDNDADRLPSAVPYVYAPGLPVF